MAKEATSKKRQELEQKTKEFEEWTAINKKKKSRQLMLTGEIPPEQIQFEKEADDLTTQINLKKQKEDFLKEDSDHSTAVLKNIKRDENQALEALNSCRKLLAKYGYDAKLINNEDKLSLSDDKDLKNKLKNNKIYSHTLVTKFRTVIDTLKKKSENFSLIVALNDLGNLNFSCDHVDAAEENWNDSLDTIFQKIYSLKSFRSILSEYPLVAHQLGVQRCLIGSILLSKLLKNCYGNNLHLQRECSLMAHELIMCIFKVTLPHPFVSIQFGDYRVKELMDKDNIFSNKYALNPSELILSCNKIVFSLMDLEKYVMALPVLGLMEYLATDIVK